MKEVLHYLDTAKLHAFNFDCDIESGSNSPAAVIKMYLQDLNLHLQLTMRALNIDCHLHSQTDLQHNMGTFPPILFSIH